MTHPRHEAPETYAREVRRHLPPMPRRMRRAVADMVERHVAERLVAEGRPAWQTIARLGPADRVAGILAEAWLEALDAGRSGVDYLRLAVRGAVAPAGFALGLIGGLMLVNTIWIWADVMAEFPDPGWTLALLLGLNLPAIATVVLPFAAFYLGLGALQALARESTAATRARLAPRVAAAFGAAGIVGAAASFVALDQVVVPANRAMVDLAEAKMALTHEGPRSPQELTYGELRDRLAEGRILTPGENAEADWRALGMKVAVPAAVATTTWSGLAWGAAFGLSRVPAMATGGLALVAGTVLGTTLTAFGWAPAWATIAGTLLPLALALPFLRKRRRP